MTRGQHRGRWTCLLCGRFGKGGSDALYDHYRRYHAGEMQT